MKNSTNTNTLLRVALAAMLVRVLFLIELFGSPFFAYPLLDQHYYHLCARQLAGAGGDIIDGFRPLLYPYFLSWFYAIDLDGGIFMAIIAQHALGVGMAVLIAFLTMRIFKNASAGLISGLLFAGCAPPLYFEGQLMITTLFSFLLLLLWVVVFFAIKSQLRFKASAFWVLSGIILGLAAQARPNALPLLLFFPALTLTRFFTSKKSMATYSPLLAIAGALCIQILFGIADAQYNGKFNLLTQAGGINFYLGNSSKADGMIPRQSKYVVYDGEYRDPIQVMANQGYMEASGTIGKVSQKDVSNYWKTKTVDEIKQDPLRWTHLMTKKMWLMLWNHEVPNNRSFSFAATHDTRLLQWLPVRWCLLLALFPWGIGWLWKNREHELLL